MNAAANSTGYRRRLIELLAIFAGRDSLWDLGQLSHADHVRLQWGVSNHIIEAKRELWPAGDVGISTKTRYYKTGC